MSGPFPDSRHVTTEGLGSADDATIWNHAAEHGLVIVTKDADFHQRSFLQGAPPKIVWLRIGNCTTDDLARLVVARTPEIRAFASDAESSFLEIS